MVRTDLFEGEPPPLPLPLTQGEGKTPPHRLRRSSPSRGRQGTGAQGARASRPVISTEAKRRNLGKNRVEISRRQRPRLLAAGALLEMTSPSEEEGSALKYEEVEDGYAVLGLDEGCTDTTVVIPDSVTDLGIQCFYKCQNLKTAKIGAYCNYLPYGSFALCTALETVIVPIQLSVVDSAFAGCENIKSVYYEGEELWPYYTVGHESDENPKNAYGNKYYSEAAFYLYSEESNPDGGHWHYNEEGKPEIWAE